MGRNLGLRWTLLAATIAAANPALAQDNGEAALDTAIDAAATRQGALALARSQDAGGEPLQAAATLESALIRWPRADDLRLAYAALLCRLGDSQSARLEIALVTSTGGTGWGEVAAACGVQERSSANASGLSGQIAVGLAFDTDAVGQTLLQPAGFAASDDGLSAVATARFAGRADLGEAFFYGDAAGITKHAIGGPDQNYQFGTASAGLGVAAGSSELSGGGILRYGRIDNLRYVTEYGGEARFSLPVGDRDRVTLRGEVLRQDYYSPGLDGWTYGGSFTYSAQPSDRIAWFLTAQIEVKSAAVVSNEYFAVRLAGGLQVTLDEQGTYAAFQSTIRYVDFGDAPLGSSRREWRCYNRAALGLPLGNSGLVLEGAVTHSYRDYNATRFINDYSNFGGELRLIWKFGRERTGR